MGFFYAEGPEQLIYGDIGALGCCLVGEILKWLASTTFANSPRAQHLYSHTNAQAGFCVRSAGGWSGEGTRFWLSATKETSYKLKLKHFIGQPWKAALPK